MYPEPHHKHAIAQAFGRAAKGYDQFAELQRASGERLLSLVADHHGEQVLDAGCGTGYFSQRWRTLGKQVTALDLSAEMLAHAAAADVAQVYLQGDIEHLPLQSDSVDICFTNLVLQWCDDSSQAIAACHRVTRPGGVVAFATLAEGSLSELSQTWFQVDGTRRVNTFLPMAQIAAACHSYRHKLYQQTLTYRFPDVLAVMQSLKGIGANAIHRDRVRDTMTRRSLQALAQVYPREQTLFPLSYHVVYGVIYCD